MLRKIPNILTIGRIIIVPFFVLAFYLPGFYGDLTALILFIVAPSARLAPFFSRLFTPAPRPNPRAASTPRSSRPLQRTASNSA